MWQTTLSACLVIVGIVHVLPGLGVLGAQQLATLYGTQITSPDLLLLMRHRAILFVIVGGLLLVSARQPTLQWSAIVAGLVSVLSFMLLAGSPSGLSAQLSKVFYFDVVALLLLLLAGAAKWLSRPAG